MSKYVFTTLLLFMIPLPTLADTAPADGGGGDPFYESTYSCEDLCALAYTCQTPCITEECLSYCQSAPYDRLGCAVVTNCDSFNDCLCQTGTEDNAIVVEDDDDDGCGCGISNRPADASLMVIMLAIGIFALGTSLRTAKNRR